MEEAIIEAEAAALACALCHAGFSAMFCLDIAAVFPSLSRKWMFMVLEASGSCPRLICIIRALYSVQSASTGGTLTAKTNKDTFPAQKGAHHKPASR